MAQFDPQGLNLALRDISSALGQQARQKIQQRQLLDAVVQQALVKERVRQLFPDPTRELANTLSILNILKTAGELRFDMSNILGGGVPQLTTPVRTVPQFTGQTTLEDSPRLRQTRQDLLGQATPQVADTQQVTRQRVVPQAIPQVPQITTPFRQPIQPVTTVDTDTRVRPTEFKPTIFGGVQPTKFEEVDRNIREKVEASAAKLTEQQTKDFLKSASNLGRVTAASKGMVSRAKQVVNEIGGFGLKQVITGKARQLLAATGIRDDISLEQQMSGFGGFEGQLVEMTLALSPILTGQNRVIRGIVRMLSKTLPSFPTTEANFTAKLRQTTENAFKISMALTEGKLTVEEIQRLNRGDDSDIDATLERLLAPKLDSARQDLFGKIWTDIRTTPASKPEPLFEPGERQFRGRGFQPRQYVIQEGAEAINPVTGEIRKLIGGRWQTIQEPVR